MGTAVIKLQDVPAELAAIIRRMHERNECIVVMDDDAPVAYFNLAFRPDLRNFGDEDALRALGVRSRVLYDPLTGVPVVQAEFGAKMITSEEIGEELGRYGP